MSKNSIEFSLSNSEQRDSWLNSGHRTLDADNDCIADAWTHCHVFLDYIQDRKKLVWGLEDNGQE